MVATETFLSAWLAAQVRAHEVAGSWAAGRMAVRARLKARPTEVQRAERRAAKTLKSEVADAIAEESRMAEVEELMRRAGQRGHSVVLQGLDSTVDEGRLRVACGTFGPIVTVCMAKVGSVPVVPTGNTAVGTASRIAKSLHCAIVDFKNQADADASVEAMHGKALFGSVVEARRAYGERFTRDLVSEHLAKLDSGERKDAQAYVRHGRDSADRVEALPPPPGISPEYALVASAAEEIVQQMEVAHSLGRPLHKVQYQEPMLNKNPTNLHDDIHNRLNVLKRAVSDAEENFATGHYKLLNAASLEMASRSKFRLPSQRVDDPADAMAPTTVETLTARSSKASIAHAKLPIPPEARKPRPPSLLDALRKRHVRMGSQTKEMWSNPKTLDGGSIFRNIERDVGQELVQIEAPQRLIPLEPEPEVSSLSDTVRALIMHYEPTPGESDGEESVESIPDDAELSEEVIDVVLELYTLKRLLAEERAALQARQRSLDDARASLADKKAALDADTGAAAKARDEVASLAGEVKRLEGELGRVMQCESDEAAADQEVKQAETAFAEATQRLGELRAQQDQARAEADRLDAALQDAEATSEAAKRRHDALSTALADVNDEERQVVKAQKEQRRLADMAANDSAAVAATEKRLATLREEETHCRSEGERLSREIENAEAIAEAARLKAEKLKTELEQAEQEIAARREKLNAELETLQPVIDAATKAVKSIKTSQLDEMKAMLKPPEGVRLTMESVMILLGKGKMDWAEIRKEVVQKGFIESVLELDANKVTKKSTELLTKSYLSNEAFKPEKIARASKAASPLCAWATAQVSYAEALRQCRPLTDEVERLRLALEEQRKAYADSMAQIDVGSPETIAKMQEEVLAVEKRLAELETALPAVEAILEKQASELASVTEQHAAATAKLLSLRPHEEVLANAEQLKKDLQAVQLGSPDEIAKIQSELDGARAAVVEVEKCVLVADEAVATQTAGLDMASAKKADITAQLNALRPKQEVQRDVETTLISLVQLVWKQLDSNQDSVLDDSELLAVLLVLEGEEKVKSMDIATIFAAVDTDGNNQIDFDEFRDWFLSDYREKVLQLGAHGLLLPNTDTDERLTQLQALTKAVERLETEVSAVKATIVGLENKEKAARELLESLQAGVPILDEHAHESIKLATTLPEWCRAEERAVLDWFGELLPSVQRPRFRAAYASDPVPELPESSDEEVELLEGWVPLASLTVSGTQLTRDTCTVGMDVEVVPYDDLQAKWRSCDALGSWSREGAAFAGKPGYVVNLPYEWDETVYIRCPDFGMTAAMVGLPETDEDDEEEEQDEEDETDDDDEFPDDADGNEPVQWSTAELEEFELSYAKDKAVAAAGQEALDRIAQIEQRSQRKQQASQWAKKGRDLEARSDYAGALAAWEKVSELLPGNTQYKKSREKVEKRCRVPMLLENAQSLLLEGKFMESAQALGRAQDLDPKNAKIRAAQQQAEQYCTAAALKKSGHSQMERGDYNAAVKSFAKAMVLNSLDKELVSLHEEASAVASHAQEVSYSYAVILMRARFRAWRAEVVASRERSAQAEAAALLERQAKQAAHEAAEIARLAAEERVKAEVCSAATKIQSLGRGLLGRRLAAQARARAADAAFKAAKAAERHAKKEQELEQAKLQRKQKNKAQGRQRVVTADNKLSALEDEERLAAAQQFHGALGLVVEGVPKLGYNTLYLPDGTLDGWPRWRSAEGKVLSRCVAEREWHLSNKGSTVAAAYCQTNGEIPIGDEWKCWNNGAWNSCAVAVSVLYTQVRQLCSI